MRLDTKVSSSKKPKNRKEVEAKRKLDKVFRILKTVFKDESFHKALDSLDQKDLH